MERVKEFKWLEEWMIVGQKKWLNETQESEKERIKAYKSDG